MKGILKFSRKGGGGSMEREEGLSVTGFVAVKLHSYKRELDIGGGKRSNCPLF